jgi:hypothetical protein
MSLQSCWKSLIVSMVVMGASNTYAQLAAEQESSQSTSESRLFDHQIDFGRDTIRPIPGGGVGGGRLDCQRYTYNPRLCEQMQGCQYSRIFSECLPANGHSNPYPDQYCSQYHQDYQGCVSAGCLFDGRSGACYEQQGGPVQPINCSIFNYDEYQCEINGCFFDRRTNLCRNRGGITPPSHRNWICSASDSGWEEHSRGHEAFGYSRSEAEQNALIECQSFHGRCRVVSCRLQ